MTYVYHWHTGYPGGQRSLSAEELFKKNPIKLVENAVKGMLPKNKLGSNLYRNLKVFSGSDHNITDNSLKEVKFNKL